MANRVLALRLITTKFYPAREDAEAEAQRSLERLGVDQVDLYIIHWPQGGPTCPEQSRASGYGLSRNGGYWSVTKTNA
jgi:diketogulonate reductase-like aldo/keto reductase